MCGGAPYNLIIVLGSLILYVISDWCTNNKNVNPDSPPGNVFHGGAPMSPIGEPFGAFSESD